MIVRKNLYEVGSKLVIAVAFGKDGVLSRVMTPQDNDVTPYVGELLGYDLPLDAEPDMDPLYVIQLPDNARTGFIITEYLVDELDVPSSALNKVAALVKHDFIYGEFAEEEPVTLRAGLSCMNSNCNTYCQYAQHNLPNNKFLCYSCRTNPITRAVVGF